MREVGRGARAVRVGVEVEAVHDRLRPVAGAVEAAEVRDEGGGGVRLAARGRVVAAVRRDRAADHVDRRVDRLQRVVALRQQPLVVARGDVDPLRAELRPPEAVEVRLVADDEVVHVRAAPSRARRRRRRTRRGRGRERRCLRAPLVDAEDDPDPVELRRVGRVLERLELVRAGLGLARSPDRRLADHVEPGELREVHLRLRRDEVAPLAASSAAPTSIPRPARAGRRTRARRARRRRASSGGHVRRKDGRRDGRKSAPEASARSGRVQPPNRFLTGLAP